jgi:glycosyltransferase involved in cell wall biosynthesis
MAGLCIVTTCMGRLAQLRQTLGPMLAQDGGVLVIVVDYSCPDGAGDWVEVNHPAARLVRVQGRSRFNASAARNIGARHADTDWIAFVDSDVMLDRGFAAELRRLVAPGGFYRCRSDDPGLGGTYVCARADFERIGGYDEVYPCWGEEDNDLFDAFEFVGLARRPYPAELVRHLTHDDAARTRYYPVGEKELGHAINRVYRLVKWDIARLNRQQPAIELRRALYETVAEKVKASFETGRANDLGATLQSGIVPGGWSLSRGLVYRLTRSADDPAAQR